MLERGKKGDCASRVGAQIGRQRRGSSQRLDMDSAGADGRDVQALQALQAGMGM